MRLGRRLLLHANRSAVRVDGCGRGLVFGHPPSDPDGRRHGQAARCHRLRCAHAAASLCGEDIEVAVLSIVPRLAFATLRTQHRRLGRLPHCLKAVVRRFADIPKGRCYHRRSFVKAVAVASLSSKPWARTGAEASTLPIASPAAAVTPPTTFTVPTASPAAVRLSAKP